MDLFSKPNRSVTTLSTVLGNPNYCTTRPFSHRESPTGKTRNGCKKTARLAHGFGHEERPARINNIGNGKTLEVLRLVRVILSRGQASVLTVVIMVAMVVFSVYAMTEYSIMLESTQSPSSLITVSSLSQQVVQTSYNSTTAQSSETMTLSEYSSSATSSSSTSTLASSSLSVGGKQVFPAAGVSSSTSGTGELTCPPAVAGSLVLTVLNSSTDRPLPGLGVTASDVVPTCAGVDSTISLGEIFTNSTGMASFCCREGSYSISVDYENASYFANAEVNSSTLTCVSLLVPSGKINVSYSGALQETCNQNNS